MKRVIITGATSMLGVSLTRLCIKNNIRVLALCRMNSNRKEHIPRHSLVTILECDLNSLKEIVPEDGSYDAFFHLGWLGTDNRDDVKVQERNIAYTLDAVQLAQKVGCNTFVGSGSQAEYGRCGEKIDENTPAFPDTAYGMAKLCAGQMARLYCEQIGMKCIWPRIFSAYGPGDSKNTLVSKLIESFLKGERPQTTAGEQKWEYLFCDDAAEALLLLADKAQESGVYCVGSGEAVTLKNYIEAIRDAIDPALDIGIGEIPYGNKQIMFLEADISKLKIATGFEPHTTFEEGIRKTIQWHKSKKGRSIWL